ncbi:unnamed protein product [Periconia digitata]|uniref:DUF6536 domain-containing protein n=1 Tax=Periconia digitata TaxID=1303443 RepID=A0A9W4USV3_9PLEO|nr:unnamed protein product [Periconia digitata]
MSREASKQQHGRHGGVSPEQDIWMESITTSSPYTLDDDSVRLLDKTEQESKHKSPHRPSTPCCAEDKVSLKMTSSYQRSLEPHQSFTTRIQNRRAGSRFHGWRMGILLGCIMSAIILCVNVGVLIFAAVRRAGFKGGFAEPFDFAPSRMSQLSSAIHIVINVLSTLLLSASNYTMQVLSSPTRAEVDKRHRKAQWFDIGVLSVHNLTQITMKRSTLCAVLVLSSVPLHLFYNSAAIYIAASSEFDVHLLPSESSKIPSMSTNTTFTHFVNETWRPDFTAPLIQYQDLYLVVDRWASTINITNQIGEPWEEVATPKNITLPIEADVPFDALLTNVTSWVKIEALGVSSLTKDPFPSFAHISYGYAIKANPEDRIQLSLNFLIIVIVCNAIKLSVMMLVLYREKSEFIVTIGDGVASFLEHRDPNTEKFCVFNKHALTAEVAHRTTRQTIQDEPDFGSQAQYKEDMFKQIDPKTKDDRSRTLKDDAFEKLVLTSNGVWRDFKYPYSSALGKDREIGSSFIFLVIFVTFILGFILVTQMISGNVSSKWGTSSTTVLGDSGHNAGNSLALAWMSNAPQIVLSFLYFAINSECTSMAGAYEWNRMALVRKGLRVTKPFGEQRSTYFLQLPLRFSLPLIAISGGLHWLLSQSLFLLRIDTVDREGNLNPGQSKSGMGFSSSSFLTLCGTFYIFVIAVGIVGRRRIQARVPFAASCSLVISAACHAPEREQETHLRRIKWGVVEERMFDQKMHCSFSSGPVEDPVPGEVYS